MVSIFISYCFWETDRSDVDEFPYMPSAPAAFFGFRFQLFKLQVAVNSLKVKIVWVLTSSCKVKFY